MSENPTNRCPKCGGEILPDAPQGLCPKCLLAQATLPTEPRRAKPESPLLEALAAAFPQLEIIGLIGQGGMGFVFKARQPKLDRFVALKILSQDLAAEPGFAERFAREGRVLARLNHPNVVAVHDFGQANGFFYLLMEFVDGVNLRQAMKAGRFTPAQAIAVVPKICEGLQYAHHEGILHRDIKPENILLDSKGRVKIADFGIAKLAGDAAGPGTLTASGAALGTVHYMAPEQIEHPEDVDQRADIYSLGVVFYEMLTGELPIGRFAAPSEKTAIDPRLDDVVLRSLEKERERRQPTAEEVKTQVEWATNRSGKPLSNPYPKHYWSLAIFAGGLGLCAVAFTIGAFVNLSSSRPPPVQMPQAQVAPAAGKLVFEKVRFHGEDYQAFQGNELIKLTNNYWNFGYLIPGGAMAQMALVYWSNDVPRILGASYVKTKQTLVDQDEDVRCTTYDKKRPPEWTIPFFGGSHEESLSNSVSLAFLQMGEGRLSVAPGQQLVLPLATNTDPGRTIRFELRLLLESLDGPAALTSPHEIEESNCIMGRGPPESMEKLLKQIRELPSHQPLPKSSKRG